MSLPKQTQNHNLNAPRRLFSLKLTALAALAALLAAGPASADPLEPQAPLAPSALKPQAPLDSSELEPQPPLAPSALKPQAPLTFDRSLESLERNRVITPRERLQLQTGKQARPTDVPAFQQACRTGALSPGECRSGVAVRGSRLRPRIVPKDGNEALTEMPSSPAGTTYNAPDSEQKRRIREQIEQRRRAEQLEADRRAEAARVARLKREEERRKRYRLLGGCTYDWSSWGKSPTGVRSVKASNCSGITEVAVDCRNTKISKLRWSKWRAWEVPSTDFEDLVVESCANVLGASKPSYTETIPSETGRVIEASDIEPTAPKLPNLLD